jgi:hypothetical protein
MFTWLENLGGPQRFSASISSQEHRRFHGANCRGGEIASPMVFGRAPVCALSTLFSVE